MSFFSNLLTAAVIYFTGPVGYAGYLAAASFASGTYADMDARRRARNAKAEYNNSLKDRYQMVKSATAARSVVYGRARVSGPLLFAHSTGDKQQFLHLVVALAGHEIDAIEGVYLNDTLLPAPNGVTGLIESGDFASNKVETRSVSLSAASTSVTVTPAAGETFVRFVTVAERWLNSSGLTQTYSVSAAITGNTATWTGSGVVPGGSYVKQGYTVTYEVSVASPRVRVRYHLGSPTTGQPFPELVAESGGKWGAATHLCRGIAAVYVRLEFDTDVFGQIGMPSVSAVVRGRKVFDPRENRFLQSAAFDLASWSKVSATATANATTAPDGTVTGEKLVQANAAAGYIAQTLTVTPSTTYTISIYAKQAEKQFLRIAGDAVSGRIIANAYFDLAAGTVASFTSGVASITSAGNGWWRCVLTGVSTGAATAAQPMFQPSTTGTVVGTGDGTSGLFLWGAQIEQRSNVSDYCPTTTTALLPITAWTDNAALCAADYLQDTTYGLGASAAEVPAYEVVGEANICDQLIPLDSLGNTQKRYTSNGTISSESSRQANLDTLMQAMSGSLVWSQGRWLMKAGAHRSPVLTISEDLLVGAPSIQPWAARRDQINRIVVTYSAADSRYTEVQAPAVTNALYLADDGGIDLVMETTCAMCTDPVRAQRLGKITLERARQAMIVRLQCNLKAYDLSPGDVVALTLSRYGWASKLFIVQERELDPDSWVITLTLRETAASVWDWNFGEATRVDLTPNTNLPNPLQRLATISGLTAESGTNQLLVAPDGSVITRAKVSWTPVTDVFVTAGGRIEVQWSPAGDVAWVDAPRVPGDGSSAYISGLSDGGLILIRARAVNSMQRTGDWATIDHVVIGKTQPPPDVTGVVLSGNTLTWAPADGIPDLAGYVVRLQYGGRTWWDTAAPLHAGIITTTAWTLPSMPSGSVTFLVKAIDTSGNLSVNAAALSSAQPLTIRNSAQTSPQAPSWPGTQTGCAPSGGVLVANGTDTFFGADAASFYGDSTLPFFDAGSYTNMVYQTSFTPSFGGRVLIDQTIVGSDYTLEIRRSNQASFYEVDTDPFFGTSTDPFFGTPGDWQTWPGALDITAPEPIDIRVSIAGGSLQGQILVLTPILDVPDVVERLSNVAIGSSGSRLPIARSYIAINNVQLTLTSTAGGQVSASVVDKDSVSGPLVSIFNSSGTLVAGTVDAQIQGY